MKQLLLIFTICLAFATGMQANGNDTLFRINGAPVLVSEFEYIYNKNNFNNKADYSEKSLREYLDLFVNFRLKVKEAESLGLDKNPKLLSELNVYQEQLYNSFYDRKHLKALVDEAIERSASDLAISHIFVSAPKGSPTGAMQVMRQRIDEAYQALENGKSFEEVARFYSEDENSKENGGYLGYFTALQIAFYPLENAAYSTPVGEYSQPVQTSLGYHIVKVNDKRPSRGMVKVAIIKLNLKKDDEVYNEAQRTKMNTIHESLGMGTEFGDLARQHSQDVSTKNNEGEMEWFGISKYAPAFEEKAFSLIQVGQYTRPFETGEALYIMKLIDKKSTVSENDRETMSKKVKQSDRYEIVRQQHIEGILKRYGAERVEPGYTDFKDEVVANLESLQFNANDLDKTYPVLKIAGKNYTNVQLGTYITANNFKYRRMTDTEKFDQLVEDFKSEKAIEFHIVEYGNENPEYGALLHEYRDGILLFDLMEERVWSKAVQDTAGLRKYFIDNRSEFTYPERARIRVYKVVDEKEAEFLERALKADPSLTNIDWLTKLRKKGISTSYDDKLIYKEDTSAKMLNWEKGIQRFDINDELAIWQITEIEKGAQKSFEDARGFVIAEYQEFLEKQWIAELRSKYKVVLDEAVFKGLIKR